MFLLSYKIHRKHNVSNQKTNPCERWEMLPFPRSQESGQDKEKAAGRDSPKPCPKPRTLSGIWEIVQRPRGAERENGLQIQTLHSLAASLLLLAVLLQCPSKARAQVSPKAPSRTRPLPTGQGHPQCCENGQNSPHHPPGLCPAPPGLPAHPALPRRGFGLGGSLPSAPH